MSHRLNLCAIENARKTMDFSWLKWSKYFWFSQMPVEYALPEGQHHSRVVHVMPEKQHRTQVLESGVRSQGGRTRLICEVRGTMPEWQYMTQDIEVEYS